MNPTPTPNPDFRPSIPPPKRKLSSSLRKPPSPSPSIPYADTANPPALSISSLLNLDDSIIQPDINIKQYRILTHCFNNNLMQYYNKKHKNLLGELQQLYKVPINKQQRLAMQNDIEGLIQRNWWKLARDVYARNNCIAKQIQEYSQGYQKYCRASSSSIQYSISMTQNIKTIQIPDLPSSHNHNHGQNNKNNNSLLIQKSRPHSSSKQSPYSNNSTRYSLHYDKQQRVPSAKYNQIFKNRFQRIDGKNQYFTQYTAGNNNLNQNGDNNQNQNEEIGECFVFIRENCRKNINNGSNPKPRFHKHTKNYSQGYFSQFQNYKITDQNNMCQSNCYMNTTSTNTPINNNNVKNNNNNNSNNSCYYKHHQYQYQYVKSINQQQLKQQQQRESNGKRSSINNHINNSQYNYNCNYNFSEQKNQIKTTNINKFFNNYNSNNSNNNNYNYNNFNTQDWNTRNKLIDELQRQKIQNKILSMNSTTFSTNYYSRPQGYKAKSKCWGTAIVGSGKIGNYQQGRTPATASGTASAGTAAGGNYENNNKSNKGLFSMLRYKS